MMRAPHFKPLLAAALLTALGSPLNAQQNPETEFRERIQVTEVLLDVLVTDPSGNVILGLDKDDFVVEVEGQPVELNSATFYSNRRLLDSGLLPESAGVSPGDVPVDRYFILFFHDQRPEYPSLTGQFLDALRWAQKWVDEAILPNDYVAVASYDHKLELHQDLTNNRSALKEALKAVAKGRDPGSNWPSRQAGGPGPSRRRNLPHGRHLSRQTRRIYSGLETLAEAAGYITGRKNLLFFSVGFGRLNDFGTYLPDERYYPPMMEILNDNNVAVYAISMFENLRDENPAQAVLGNVLSLLAADTGGRYYFNFVNFQVPLQKVVDDNSGYYLLSFSAEHPLGERGYREVEVATRNPVFKLRARKGYRYGT